MSVELKRNECLKETEAQFRSLERRTAERIRDAWVPAGFEASMEIDANDDIGLVLFMDRNGVWSAQLGMQSWEIGKKPEFHDLLDVYAIIEQDEDYMKLCATPLKPGLIEVLRNDYLDDPVHKGYLMNGLMDMMEEFMKEEPPSAS